MTSQQQLGSLEHVTQEAKTESSRKPFCGAATYQVLLAANYSEKQARKGRKAIPAAVFELMTRDERRAYREMGETLLRDPVQLENYIVGYLYLRALAGEDQGVKAAELLGKHTGVLRLTERAHMEVRPLVIMAPSWAKNRDGAAALCE